MLQAQHHARLVLQDPYVTLLVGRLLLWCVEEERCVRQARKTKQCVRRELTLYPVHLAARSVLLDFIAAHEERHNLRYVELVPLVLRARCSS